MPGTVGGEKAGLKIFTSLSPSQSITLHSPVLQPGLGRVLEVLALGRGQLGEGHDGRVLVLDRPRDPPSVWETVRELLQTWQ